MFDLLAFYSLPMYSRLLAKITQLLCCVLLVYFPAVTAAAETPNIVLIMADDVGYGDISFYNKHIESKKAHVQTPSIDALAEHGVWFTDAHSPTALCSPTRYSVMSGNSPFRSYAPWGVWSTFKENAITQDDLTLGRVAKAAGYETAFVGKWHLGGTFYRRDTTTIYEGKGKGEETKIPDLKNWIAGHPRELGFDYDFTVPSGVQGPLYLAYENSKWYPLSASSELIYTGDVTAKNSMFIPDDAPGMADSAWNPTELNKLLASKAEQFILTNAGKVPFLLTYWSPAVHTPHTPPQQWGGENIAGTTVTAHLDMMKTLDQEVSTIVAALKSAGVYDNTLIVFTSDNGGLVDDIAEKVGHNSPGNLRGSKGSIYEGGHRVPFIVSWPGTAVPGSQSDALVDSTDLVATFSALLGVPVSTEQAKDSWNILPLFRGSENVAARTELITQSATKLRLHSYREKNWKLLLHANKSGKKFKPVGLFDLSKNSLEDESENLLKNRSHKDRIKRMLKRYIEIRESGIRTAPLNEVETQRPPSP